MKRIKVFIKKLNKNKKGFTFVECIVAVALFAIIGTLAFSMFSNATRYMSKARQEEAKQNAAESMALQDTYKNADGNYIIYNSSVLVISQMVNPSTPTAEPIMQYSVRLAYTTQYGAVSIEVPVKLAPDKNKEQPGSLKTFEYKRYMVLVDGLNGNGIQSGRKIYVYDDHDENGILSEEEEYVD